LGPGDRAPSFSLDGVADPWSDGDAVLVFFKVTCPVCQLAAPKVQALADGGARVVAIGEDPPEKLEKYAAKYGQRAPTVSEPAPYPVSEAYGLEAVPTVFLVGRDGVIADAVAGWDREGWNRVAAAAGASRVSDAGDGLPPFRPG
jgi:peroxiredoxin